MTRDHLDDAIDRVSARLVAGPADHGALARRIVEGLPDRSPRWRWLVPQLAVAGTMALAAMIWIARADSPALPSSFAAMPVELARSVNADAPRTDRVSANIAALDQTADDSMALPFGQAADFERALEGLSVDQVATWEITAPGAIELAPIEITTIAMPEEVDRRRQES